MFGKLTTTTTVLGAALAGSILAALAGCAPETQASTGETVSTTSEALSADTSSAAYGGDDSASCDANHNNVRPSWGVSDPGVRGGVPGAGTPLAGLNVNELALFNDGILRVTEVEATCDTCSDLPINDPIPPTADPQTTNSAGLGATFNDVRCALGCHSQPTIGGSSPAKNPSYFSASAKGATNRVFWFDEVDGPTREVRQLFNADGSRNGGVVQKFTAQGRSDAPSCTLAQPNFESMKNNISFRIPTPLFGLGIIDSIRDVEILAHKNSNLARKAQLGINGVANTNGNTGTITKFGWKAQNVSIALFAGEAYNVEMGETNEVFPQSKSEYMANAADFDNCNLTAEPTDVTHTRDGSPTDPADNFDIPIRVLPAWMKFQVFMRFMDQPKPAAFNASATRGQQTFAQIGCSECHVPSMQVRPGEHGPQTDALKGVTANLYSDLLVHHMGSNLADNVIQGNAGPDQFRSSPLWGVGQRIHFLHDGRTKSLVDAIFAHYSAPTRAHGNTPAYPASEANATIVNFAVLPASKQQDVINFLRSL